MTDIKPKAQGGPVKPGLIWNHFADHSREWEKELFRPADATRLIPSRWASEVKLRMPDGDIHVVENPYGEDDKVYMVDQTAFRKTVSFKPYEVPMEFDTKEWQDRITRIIAESFALPSYLLGNWNQPKDFIVWLRRPGEKYLDWGERLNKQGLLDDPNIRWEYQKGLWDIVKGWFKRG